jgi:hypothetical protein
VAGEAGGVSHLIHIGYAKTASNFLRAWFAAHPEIGFAPGGIAGFQDVYALGRLGAAAAAEPRWRVTSSEVLATPHPDIGDTISYDRRRRAALPDEQAAVCGRLSETFPGAHILIVTRGFRSMILSSYSQYVRTGGPLDLEALVADAQESAAWHYDHLIGLYRSAFGADKVIVLPWELLRDDPAAFAGAIERRLGLRPGPLPDRRYNPSLSGEELRWYPRLTRTVLALPVGERLRRRLFHGYARAAFANRLRRPIGLLQRLRPAAPVTAEVIPQAVVEAYRGQASLLAAEPLFEPYAAEYLF